MNGSCISHERCMQEGKKNISKFSSLYVSKPKIVKTNILSTRNLKKKAKANFRYFHVFCEWAQKISEKKNVYYSELFTKPSRITIFIYLKEKNSILSV